MNETYDIQLNYQSFNAPVQQLERVSQQLEASSKNFLVGASRAGGGGGSMGGIGAFLAQLGVNRRLRGNNRAMKNAMANQAGTIASLQGASKQLRDSLNRVKSGLRKSQRNVKKLTSMGGYASREHDKERRMKFRSMGKAGGMTASRNRWRKDYQDVNEKYQDVNKKYQDVSHIDPLYYKQLEDRVQEYDDLFTDLNEKIDKLKKFKADHQRSLSDMIYPRARITRELERGTVIRRYDPMMETTIKNIEIGISK